MDRNLLLLTSLRLAAQLHAQQPAHHWPLDAASGLLAADIAGGENGLVYGNSTWQPGGGHHAGALFLNGNDARVVAGPCDLTTGTGDAITLACWFKPNIVSGTERVLVAKTVGPLEQDHVWALSLVNGTGARFRVRAAGQVHVLEVPGSSIFSNAWYHLAGTYDGSTMRLYLNGALMVSQPAAGTIGFHPQAPASMGDLATGGKPFFGTLDDVRIYDSALDQAAVIDLVIGTVITGGTSTDHPVPDRSVGAWERVRVYDLTGRTVFDGPYQPAPIRPFEGVVPPGIYVVCLHRGAERQVLRVHLP
ncbi:MAG: LamG domain-containing protein [Flavobacteriales bacterium]|nr:LamG domain-containing protein [Flavobacteriales bacterium]